MKVITREEYLEFAKRNEVPMVLLFEYYNKFNQKANLNFSLESFDYAFTQFLVNFAVNLEPVRAYYNKLYEVVTVYDKQGNFITIY